VSSSKQLIEVVKQIPRGSEKKGSDTSSSPTTNDPSSTSVATTTVAAGHKTSQSPDLPTAVAASQSVPRSKKKKRSAESRKEVSKNQPQPQWKQRRRQGIRNLNQDCPPGRCRRCGCPSSSTEREEDKKIWL